MCVRMFIDMSVGARTTRRELSNGHAQRMSPRMPAHMPMHKGFGFIKPDDGSDDVFCHRKEMDGKELVEGEPVTYLLGENRDGRRCAKQVRIGKMSGTAQRWNEEKVLMNACVEPRALAQTRRRRVSSACDGRVYRYVCRNEYRLGHRHMCRHVCRHVGERRNGLDESFRTVYVIRLMHAYIHAYTHVYAQGLRLHQARRWRRRRVLPSHGI